MTDKCPSQNLLTEEKTMHEYKFPMAAVTSTMAVLAWMDNQWHVLLAKRHAGSEAFPGYWSLPGGFLNVAQETTLACAVRELMEECNLFLPPARWHVIGVDDNVPGTDPRYDHVVNIAYGIIAVNEDGIGDVRADDDVDEVRWVPVLEAEKQELAFEHSKILSWATTLLINES